MSENQDANLGNNISGILSNWAVVTFSHNGELLINEAGDVLDVTLLMGDVDVDYKKRFWPGSYIKTSLVQHFDKTDFTVKTKNSCYQLSGCGYEVVADVRFYSLFMDAGFYPEQIINGFPRLIYECEFIEASNATLH